MSANRDPHADGRVRLGSRRRSPSIGALRLVVAVTLLAGCRIDFGADIPCDSDDDCPRDKACDAVFFRCVEGGGLADTGDADVDDVATDTPTEVVDDGGQDPPADVPTDAPDAPVDVPSDGSGADAPDVVEDADVGCVPTGEEVCDDGVDNDCNGLIDDPPICDVGPCGDDMTLVEPADATAYCIDTWEASRPDATGDDPGTDTSAATSRAGVLPWSTISLGDADAACAAAGKRLCSAFEWQSACAGPEILLYPYGNSYESSTCNGSNAPPLDGPDATGSFDGCASVDGTFDQSGNLAEWTADGILRGGAFADPQLNLRCNSRSSDPGGSPLAWFGFRCCKDGP